MFKAIRKHLNLIIGLSLAVLLIWLFFKDSDWNAIGSSIATANVYLLAFGLAIQMLGIWIKSWRWRLLLFPIKPDIPVSSCWKYFNIGFASTSLLPGRVGEVLRPYLIAREQKIKFLSSFATIVTERVIDLVMILIFFATIFVVPETLGPDPNQPGVVLLKTAGLVSMAVAALAILFLVFVKFRTDWAIGLVRFFTKPFPGKISKGLENLVSAFAEGVGGLSNFAQVAGLLISTVAAWTTGPVFYWLTLKAFGIDVPFIFCFFLQAAAGMGVVIPTPAGSGGYHAAVILVLATLWGFPVDVARSYALSSHIIIFGSMTLIGSYYLMKGKIKLFDAAEKASLEGKDSKVTEEAVE